MSAVCILCYTDYNKINGILSANQHNNRELLMEQITELASTKRKSYIFGNLALAGSWVLFVLTLGIAAVILLPYTLLTEDYTLLRPDTSCIILVLIAGIIHTGIAYALYFGSIRALPAQTAALYSYIAPILAILLSALFLREPLSLAGIVGAVMILGAAIVSET